MFFQVLIKNSKDLRNVEPHKLVILFVDFNNRNIILENENTEIGNLRNDTTKFFLSLKCKLCHRWWREFIVFMLFVSLVVEKFLINILFDIIIVKTANNLFNVGNLICVESGDVFVVYCKDKGSQDLSPNNLYNLTLQSIEEHPVLSELKRNNRILTINDKFHPHQVEHLKKCCQQLWRYLLYWNKL